METSNNHLAAAIVAIAQLAEATLPRHQEFKSLKQLAHDLRVHANNYLLGDGQLCADLNAAANYLEALS